MNNIERLKNVVDAVRKFNPRVEVFPYKGGSLDFYFTTIMLKKVTSSEIGWLRTNGATFGAGMTSHILSFVE